MNIIITVAIVIISLFLIVWIYNKNVEKIYFFSTGMDKGFRLNEIRIFWALAKKSNLETPLSLYDSVSIMNKCINKVIEDSKANGTESKESTQQFLSKLYKYRTRIALDNDGKKGIDNTRRLDIGQRFSIILPGKGVFSSKLINNGRELIISLPIQDDKKNKRQFILTGDAWVGKKISMYLWRKGDACYAFDTEVTATGLYQNQVTLLVKHSDKLDRTQKRQSVRANCEIYAQMYMQKSETEDYNLVETSDGFTCLLEDISEDGAMIRIGSKGKANVRIKLQFTLNDTLIIMYGIIRAVEYNKILDQSRLHFECTHVEPFMKNAILTYVYNVIPEEQKNRFQALKQTEVDKNAEEGLDLI